MGAKVTTETLYRMIKKELYNGIPNVTMWQIFP
jgi:hypothetical protein